MSKNIVSVLTAVAVLAPAMPVSAKTAVSSDRIISNQYEIVSQTIEDASTTVNTVIDLIDIETEQTVGDVSYVYVEAPIYTPVVYYEPMVVEHTIQSVKSTPVEENVPNEDYQIALANYESALAAYNAASELIETIREEEVEVFEDVTDEEGTISTVTRTEIQTVTETNYAGDVEAAKAALDDAAAVLEQTPEFITAVTDSPTAMESITVSAEEADSETASNSAAENQCGDDATWTMDAMGNLTITGTGSMYDYTAGNTPWYSQKLMLNTVTINSGITRIGDYAFYNCQSITSLNIADTVTEIGKMHLRMMIRLVRDLPKL